MTAYENSVGDVLRLIRKHRRGISQQKFADLVGYDHSFQSRLEAGSRNPSMYFIRDCERRASLTAEESVALRRAAGFMGPLDVDLAREPVVARLWALLTNDEVARECKTALREVVSNAIFLTTST